MSAVFDHTPQAWLYAYIQTTTPGYRTISIGGVVYTIPDNGAAGVIWPDFITALSGAISGASWAASIQSTGRVIVGGSSAALVWPDRLGALLGMAVQSDTTIGTVIGVGSQVIPYGGIPLYGATWETVTIERDVRYEVSRMARSHGYVYGGARLWLWRLTCSHHALTAIRRGFVLNRKIRVQGLGLSAIGASHPDGYLEGWPLGIKRVAWLDKLQRVAQVDILVTAGSV